MKKWFLKLIGHKFENRFKWGEFYWTWHPKKWEFSLQLTDRYSNPGDMLIFHPLFFKSYIYLPTHMIKSSNILGESKSYGFYIYERLGKFHDVVFKWGRWSKHIEMPWNYEWYSTELIDMDTNRVVCYEDKHSRKYVKWHDIYETMDYWKKKISKTYKYTYKSKHQKQKVDATVYVERRTWRMRGFPWIKKSTKAIDVQFSSEVGEGIQSWKGGCIGCSYDMNDGETPLQTLRRMEKERRFHR